MCLPGGRASISREIDIETDRQKQYMRACPENTSLHTMTCGLRVLKQPLAISLGCLPVSLHNRKAVTLICHVRARVRARVRAPVSANALVQNYHSAAALIPLRHTHNL